VACEAIVPGDVVRLKAGDLVPADGLILSEANAHANEAVLTGEVYSAYMASTCVCCNRRASKKYVDGQTEERCQLLSPR
jgi:P-type E1-E2 ATPase